MDVLLVVTALSPLSGVTAVLLDRTGLAIVEESEPMDDTDSDAAGDPAILPLDPRVDMVRFTGFFVELLLLGCDLLAAVGVELADSCTAFWRVSETREVGFSGGTGLDADRVEPFSGLSLEGVLDLSEDFRVVRLEAEGTAVGLGFSGADFLLLAGVFFSTACFSLFFFDEDVTLLSSLFKFLLLVLMAGESVLASSAFLAVFVCFLVVDLDFSAGSFSLAASLFAEAGFS